MQLKSASIPNAVEIRDGLPRPDWSVVAAWVDAHVAEADLDDAWTCLAGDWVDTLAAALPGGYRRAESDEFLLLIRGDNRTADRVLGWCEHARRVILDTLSGVAHDDGYGKHVVLAFDSDEHYYDYIADFYPDEGEFGLSGGMVMDQGYGHFAICMYASGAHDRVIAHELNHSLLRHLPLPLWLNEGVTQVIEDLVVGSSDFMVDREILCRHTEYWNETTIHEFWSGDSFYSPDDGQELSYHLAQIIVRNLMSDYPKRLLEFLLSATHEDAGNAALIESCGVSLGDRVGQFLGPGKWNPRSVYVVTEE